jgi:hypothetical protein
MQLLQGFMRSHFSLQIRKYDLGFLGRFNRYFFCLQIVQDSCGFSLRRLGLVGGFGG